MTSRPSNVSTNVLPEQRKNQWWFREISRLERRDNLHLATPARFIEATDGWLRIVSIFNDEEVEVTVSELASPTEQEPAGAS